MTDGYIVEMLGPYLANQNDAEIRWLVESVYGVLKQKYRPVDHKIDNKLIPKIGSYFRTASIFNKTFGKRLQSDVDNFDDILQRMHSQRHLQNTLATEVEEKGWVRRKLPFKSVTSEDILDFPEMTGRDIKILFTGTYQLAQAVSYFAEMVNTDGKLRILYVKYKSNVLTLKVPPRHISRSANRCF